MLTQPTFHITAWTAIVLTAILSLPAAALGDDAPAELPPATRDIRSFDVRPASSAIQIDAVLDEPAWDDALIIDLPYEWFPGDNVRPPVRTECLVTYSERQIFVAFRAHDPEPRKIRAHLMDRDSIGSFVQDDHVGFQVDPFNDERRAWQFRANPLGVQVDGTFDEIEGLEDFAWDAIWDSAGRLTEGGYVVEMAVPFQQLRFPKSDAPQTWGFEAFRNYPRTDRHRISSKYTDRDKDCTLCQENKIRGFEGLTPGLNLEINPTLTGVRTEARDDFPSGALGTAREDGEAGLDVRWGITSSLALNATANPDFSQVEADTAQLDINTRFALFFPEKRPFFLEGADFFDTPLRAVFTRTMADPNGGLKLTGKEGKSAIGVFLVEDDQNNLILPGNQGSRFAFLEDEVTSGVLRYRRDVGPRSTIGVLYAGREGDDYHNRLGGFDGFLRFNTSNSLRFQWLRSDTLYPDGLAEALGQTPGEAIDGDALHLSYLHLSREWLINATWEDLDREFRADSGFIPRVDVKSADLSVERRFWGDGKTWYRRFTVGAEGERVEDQSGLVTDEGVELFATLNGPLQSFVELRLGRKDEFFAGETFTLDTSQVFFQVKPTGKANINALLRFGEAIDLANGQEADEILVSPGFELRLGRRVNWLVDYLYQTLDGPDGELFEANLAQTRVIYQFNVRTFVRAIFQYTDITRDPDLFAVPVEPETEELFTQLLFSYKINPRTVLFAGYTDNRLGFEDITLTQLDRTFFLKVGYAFLF